MALQRYANNWLIGLLNKLGLTSLINSSQKVLLGHSLHIVSKIGRRSKHIIDHSVTIIIMYSVRLSS